MSELKPCPFCGGEAVIYDAFYCTPKSGIDKVEYWCGCSECDVETAIDGNDGSKDGAIAIWNTRATDEQLTTITKQRDELVSALKTNHEWLSINSGYIDSPLCLRNEELLSTIKEQKDV